MKWKIFLESQSSSAGNARTIIDRVEPVVTILASAILASDNKKEEREASFGRSLEQRKTNTCFLSGAVTVEFLIVKSMNCHTTWTEDTCRLSSVQAFSIGCGCQQNIRGVIRQN